MKKFLTIFIASAMLAATVFAGLQPAQPPVTAVTFVWDASTNLVAPTYTLYYGTNSRNYSVTQSAGTNTTTTVTGLPRGIPYYFAVTVTDPSSALESDFSAEVIWTFASKPLPPTNPHVGAASK